MPIIPNTLKRKLQAGGLGLGFGVNHLRTSATPMIAAAAGHDWLFLDTEHGAFSVQEVTQLCIAALPTGITPIVRVCTPALDEGTRALDNGAQGIIVPHVDTVEDAKRVADAFRYPPIGSRSWGGPPFIFGFDAPSNVEAQKLINDEILIVGMIESGEALANVDGIAAVPGIDILLIGVSDLSADLGISGQIGHARITEAFETVQAACARHGKILGMGGVYDVDNATRYIKMGARLLLSGSDHTYMLAAGKARADALRAML
jgi:2-keto-3-deoxy-L-rhamnonate aldolase RhmA